MNYLIFLAVLCADFMSASVSEDLQKTSLLKFLQVWVIAMTLWFIFDELFELKR